MRLTVERVEANLAEERSAERYPDNVGTPTGTVPAETHPFRYQNGRTSRVAVVIPT